MIMIIFDKGKYLSMIQKLKVLISAMYKLFNSQVSVLALSSLKVAFVDILSPIRTKNQTSITLVWTAESTGYNIND